MIGSFEAFRQMLETVVCNSLVVQGYEYRGTPTRSVTALYLGTVAGEWLRFNIDAGEFHWRKAEEIERIEQDGDFGYPLQDLTWARLSAELAGIAATLEEPTPGEAVLTLAFADETRLVLSNAQDESRLSIGGGIG